MLKLVIIILNFIAVRRKMGLRLSMLSIIIKPAVCGAVMYGVIWLVMPYFSRCGSIICLAAAGGISCAAYVLSVILTGTISVREVRRLMG